MKNTTGKKTKCHKCSYEWLYTGGRLLYATCPKCKYNVRIAPYKQYEYPLKKHINNTIQKETTPDPIKEPIYTPAKKHIIRKISQI